MQIVAKGPFMHWQSARTNYFFNGAPQFHVPMISGIYILDLKGKILISRQYRADISSSLIAEKFITLLQESQELSTNTTASSSATTVTHSSRLDPTFSPPILSYGGYHYLYIRHADIYCRQI